ncbi:efflux RND transporter permease subunit [Methyloligella sp. 2.7D]|uniref:efflux RND transporter permease subunit n=1 Tax=unclassified Methyloligella TaxID=2625955 RepID=UPI00157DC3A9|nr:efflux RND transporter permease subunit [Methyloligella sp. GL2]QKP78411.1 efflux RND transporter permease subunit [Methyloligella sp. GL2]
MFERIVTHGTLVAVATLIICVLGIVAAFRIPVQMIPDLEVRTVTVQTRWSGATPQDIEKEILIEQEEYLRSIPSLERLIARAESGSAEIELEFPYDIDLNETLIRINNALSQVPSYPENVDQPRIFASSFSANSFMFFRVSPLPGNPRQLDMDMMLDFVEDEVRPRLENVPGVENVRVGGGAEKQIQIVFDAAALAERNLSLTEVREAVRNRNRDTSGGEIESGKRRYLLRTIGRFDDPDSLKDLIIARRGGTIIRLGDVADVKLGHFEIYQRAFVNERPIIFVSIRREPGSNVIAIKKAIMEQVGPINEDILKPTGMILEKTADDVTYVEASIANVWTNLAIGAVLATLVMYLFLRSPRATLVGILGIPICTIAAFIGLALAGRTINVISLAGVAFAIGMTLDNSIVVLESIDLERRRGLDRLRAAIEGVRKVWPAVLASTLTTVLVFVPILFIAEEAGQLYSDIAIAVSASILASMLVAIMVIPTAAAYLDLAAQGKTAGAGRGDGLIVRGVSWLTATAFRRFAVIAGVIAASVVVIVLLTPPAEYLPEGEEPKVFARMNAPPGYNLDTMSQIGEELNAELMPFVDDDPARFHNGEVDVPALKYVFLRIEAEGLRIVAETVDPGDIEALMSVLTRKFESYAGMRAFVSRGSIITSNDGGTRSISLDISGRRLQDVYAVASAAYDRANEIFDHPRIQADPPTLTLSQPLIEVRPNWERAAELGMTADDLGFTVASFTDGAYVGEFFQDDEKIDIYFYSRNGLPTSLDTVGQLPVHTPQGTIVPLAALADIHETVDTSTIRRIDGKRTVTLNIIPPESVALETGVGIVKSQLVDYLRETAQVPYGVSMDISGASDDLDATRSALFSNYVVAIVIIYLLLVAIFTHWGYPLLIMTAIPLGVAGGLVGLAVMNWVGSLLPMLGMEPLVQPFDMITMLGFLILMGTVVNNPILIVDRALYNVRDLGMGGQDAVMEAVSSRLRPIAMSTVTTICGLAPLVFIPGAGTELYRGVGAIVLFGILGTAIVTLTFLPALTLAVFRFAGYAKRPVRLKAASKAAAPDSKKAA